MGRFIDAMRAQLTGRRIPRIDGMDAYWEVPPSLDSSPTFRVAHEIVASVTWKAVGDMPDASSNTVEQFRRQAMRTLSELIYEEVREISVNLQRAIYHRDDQQVQEYLKQLMREVM